MSPSHSVPLQPFYGYLCNTQILQPTFTFKPDCSLILPTQKILPTAMAFPFVSLNLGIFFTLYFYLLFGVHRIEFGGNRLFIFGFNS